MRLDNSDQRSTHHVGQRRTLTPEPLVAAGLFVVEGFVCNTQALSRLRFQCDQQRHAKPGLTSKCVRADANHSEGYQQSLDLSKVVLHQSQHAWPRCLC